MSKQQEEEEEQEIVTKINLWTSYHEDEQFEIQNEKELNYACFRFDLETIKIKGFQNPKFVIFLAITCFVINWVLILLVYGYSTNWDVFAFVPILVAAIVVLPTLLIQLNQSQKQQKFNQVKQLFLVLVKIMVGICYSFSAIYTLVVNTPFDNATIFLIAIYPIKFLSCFMACVCGNQNRYNNDDNKNNNNKNNQIQISDNAKPRLFKIRQNKNLQNVKIYSQNDFRTQSFQVDKWKIYRQRIWEGCVLSIMFIDVITDVYYGFVLFQIYGGMSKFLRISGVLLVLCCVADLAMVIGMIIFPGAKVYFAHTIAFVMEIPNFVLSGVSIWKVQQLINQSAIENYDGQYLAIFSIITTLLNALIHLMYIVDSWTIQSAVQYFQEMQ